MIIRFVGLAVLLTSGILGAFSAAAAEKKKLTVLDGWYALISHIRTQIDCYLSPVDVILGGCDPVLLRSCGTDGEAKTLSEMVGQSSPYLGEETRRYLDAFAAEFGTTYREEQLKRCDFLLSALEKQREKVSRDLPARIRLAVTLFLCSAAGIAILVW